MHRSTRLPVLAAVTALTSTLAAVPAAAQTQVAAPGSYTALASFRVRSTNVPSQGQEVLYNAGAVGVSTQSSAGGVISSPATFQLVRTGQQYSFSFLSGWAGSGVNSSQPFVVNAAEAADRLRFEVQSLNQNFGAVSFTNLAIGATPLGDGVVASNQAGSVAEYYDVGTGDFTVTGTINFASPFGTNEQQRFEINAYSSGLSSNVIPEPSTYALMGAGLAGLLAGARRRRSA